MSAQTAPQTADDCWFVEMHGGDTAGYPQKKLSNRGGANKWRVHQILHYLSHPDLDENDRTLELSHLCRRGRFDFALGITRACVNPVHTTLADHNTNLSQNTCGNGCAHLCPHQPRCVWTNGEGRRMRCREIWPMPAVCGCGAGCY